MQSQWPAYAPQDALPHSPTPLGHRAASANVIADDAVSDQDSEQDTGPGDETENILPAAMLLAENPLVDHLK